MTTPPSNPTTATAQRTGPPVGRRKLLAAGLIGSSIEWYDFFVYGTAAALVFPHIFFPEASALTGTLLSFSTFWAGFVARPVGGVLAGHLGDKYGRKPVVVGSLLTMGLATVLVGCLPTADTIGVAAPTLLVTLRLMQGLACGGQWGGIVLLLTESSDAKRRGFTGTFGQMGVPVGLLIGTVAFLVTAGALSEEAFLGWGWRVPFLASAVLFPVVLYIQTKVEDTPEFRELQAEVAAKRAEQQAVPAPLAQAVRSHWRVILLGCGLLAATNSLFYISIAGVLSYGTTQLGMDKDAMLAASLFSMVVGIGVILWSGWMSDRVGRRPMIIIGAAGLIVWGFPYFWLVNTADMTAFVLAVTVGSVFQSMTYGPLAAYLGELFEANVRMSGMSLAYQLAAVTVSGGTPFLMTALIATTGTTTLVSVFLCLMGAVTLLSAWVLRETNPESIRMDPAAVPGTDTIRTGV